MTRKGVEGLGAQKPQTKLQSHGHLPCITHLARPDLPIGAVVSRRQRPFQLRSARPRLPRPPDCLRCRSSTWRCTEISRSRLHPTAYRPLPRGPRRRRCPLSSVDVRDGSKIPSPVLSDACTHGIALPPPSPPSEPGAVKVETRVPTHGAAVGGGDPRRDGAVVTIQRGDCRVDPSTSTLLSTWPRVTPARWSWPKGGPCRSRGQRFASGILRRRLQGQRRRGADDESCCFDRLW